MQLKRKEEKKKKTLLAWMEWLVINMIFLLHCSAGVEREIMLKHDYDFEEPHWKSWKREKSLAHQKDCKVLILLMRLLNEMNSCHTTVQHREFNPLWRRDSTTELIILTCITIPKGRNVHCGLLILFRVPFYTASNTFESKKQETLSGHKLARQA
eukprot:TRINITY_DN3707_c0_g1_i12.p1 TRINITY_DN3707_c0_g1~~TRINITY_DN3707_c0_g1_i12.p1  ORF type:complete len:155 (+),score=23.28 TRINITY_DN3707_c0_g1_i12:283-747(+)